MVTIQLTPEQFAAKCAELKAQKGIELVGTQGTAAKDGVSIEWCYDPAVGELSCHVTQKPRFTPLPLIEGRLRSWLTANG